MLAPPVGRHVAVLWPDLRVRHLKAQLEHVCVEEFVFLPILPTHPLSHRLWSSPL